MSASVSHLQTVLVDTRRASRNELRGCSEEEIRQVEIKFGVSLPAFYATFLKTMGRGAGNFMRGSSVFYPELLSLREYAEELLAEVHAKFRLNSEDFVFFVHQGYQFAYFQVGGADDPEVWYFCESWDGPRKKCSALSAFFEAVARDEATEV